MTTAAGSGGQVGIVIEAVDRATRVIRNVSQSLRRQLGSAARSAMFSMLSFTSVLGAAGLSIYALTRRLTDLFKDIQATNRAAALLGTQFRLAGFSIDRADAAVARLRENLSRTALQALPGLDQASREFLAGLGPESLRELDAYAVKLSEITGVERQAAFKALVELVQGNRTEMEKLGIAAGDYETALREIDQAHQDLLKNETALETLWRNIKNNFSRVVDDMVEDANRLLGDEGWAGVAESIGNILGGITGAPNLGTMMREDIEKARLFLEEFSWEEWQETGKRIATQMAIGFLIWLLGEDAVKIIQLAWHGNWNAVWEKLKPESETWGRDLATAIRDGLIKFILGDTFGKWVIDALNSEGGLMGKLKGLWPEGGNWGKNLGIAIINGLIGAIEWGINRAVGKINEWIQRVEDVLNRIPGMNFNLGRVGGIAIPRMSLEPDTGPELGPGGHPLLGLSSNRGQGMNAQAPLSIQMSGREVARVVVEVMNGELRIRQPGLGIT